MDAENTPLTMELIDNPTEAWKALPRVQQVILMLLYEAYYTEESQSLDVHQLTDRINASPWMTISDEELEEERLKMVVRYKN
jgi:hypothetical protein